MRSRLNTAHALSASRGRELTLEARRIRLQISSCRRRPPTPGIQMRKPGMRNLTSRVSAGSHLTREARESIRKLSLELLCSTEEACQGF
ncbi:unnamed protein product [Pleuronectes platessa]|uniref:Uncharacterized protein n=1 Tax=Pleuronectes platessa TaxID=8262 RepID=A0A9N7UDN2_PLEPL|nr:unnamed protein product [Pleuronectes platessa]